MFLNSISERKAPQIEFNEKFCGVYWETPEQKSIENEEIAVLRRELTLLSKQYREITVKYYA